MTSLWFVVERLRIDMMYVISHWELKLDYNLPLYLVRLYFSFVFLMLGNTDVSCWRNSLFALQNAFLNLVPQKTYTKKLVEELMERARWASQDIFRMRAGVSCQQTGGPLRRQLRLRLSCWMLLWVSIAAVDLIHIRDELYALADDEEDDNQDQDPGHTRLVPQVNIFLSNCRKKVKFSR